MKETDLWGDDAKLFLCCELIIFIAGLSGW